MARGKCLLLALLLSSCLSLGAASCLQALRTPPYEAYWLESPSERYASVRCLAIRVFRLTLKFIKVTYERWTAEMDYAKCIMEKLGISAAFLSPPWARNSRSTGLMSPVHKIFSSPMKSSQHEQRTDVPKPSKQPLRQYKSLIHKNESSYMTFLPVLDPRKSDTRAVVPRQSTAIEDSISYLQSWYSTIYSYWQQIASLFPNGWNNSLFVCTRTYIKRAFWRWIDGTPFVR